MTLINGAYKSTNDRAGKLARHDEQCRTKWWYAGIKKLIELGVAGIWNDNNEYALLSGKHLCCGTDKERDHKTAQVGRFGRMVNTDIMEMVSLRASVNPVCDGWNDAICEEFLERRQLDFVGHVTRQ